MDALLGTREGRVESSVTSNIRSLLQNRLCGEKPNPRYFSVIGTTNYPGDFGDAFKRRFDFIKVPSLVTIEQRLQVLQMNCEKYVSGYTITDAQFVNLARSTDRYSGADLARLVANVRRSKLDQAFNAKYFTFDVIEKLWKPVLSKQKAKSLASKGQRVFSGTYQNLQKTYLHGDVVRPLPISHADFEIPKANMKISANNEVAMHLLEYEEKEFIPMCTY